VALFAVAALILFEFGAKAMKSFGNAVILVGAIMILCSLGFLAFSVIRGKSSGS
jgi:hypothetical protein